METLSIAINGLLFGLAVWIDLRVSNMLAARDAGRGLHPLHRLVSVAHLGAAEVEEAERADPGKICSEGFAWMAVRSRPQFSREFVQLSQQE